MNPAKLEKAKLYAWQNYAAIQFMVPPVCTAEWEPKDWIKFIDWTTPNNAELLEKAMTEVEK